MPRPLAAWMNGQIYSFGGAEASARKNTQIPPASCSIGLPGDGEVDVFTCNQK